jgi:hypothetical protein
MKGLIRSVLRAHPAAHVLAAVLALVPACGDEPARDADGGECADSSGASLEPYYVPCSGPEDFCPAPYACVNSNVDREAEPFYACLIACCDSDDCPAPHGCMGDPDFPVADVAADGFCAESP